MFLADSFSWLCSSSRNESLMAYLCTALLSGVQAGIWHACLFLHGCVCVWEGLLVPGFVGVSQLPMVPTSWFAIGVSMCEWEALHVKRFGRRRDINAVHLPTQMFINHNWPWERSEALWEGTHPVLSGEEAKALTEGGAGLTGELAHLTHLLQNAGRQLCQQHRRHLGPRGDHKLCHPCKLILFFLYHL